MLGRLKSGGVSLHMIDLGGGTTGNGVSKLIFTILSAVAEAERERTRGRYLGGILPFGHRLGEDGALVPIPEMQRAIRNMARLKGQGLSLRAIAGH